MAASYPDVLEPAQLGPLRLRNRVIKAATFEGMTTGAVVSDNLADYHRQVSEGGVGMTTVAYLAVAPEGRTEDGQIWMRPEALPGLARLVEAVHDGGAAVSALVAMARALLREPDLINRIALGADTRSRCIHCNKCMATIYSGTRCVVTTPPLPVR